jgi:membrane-associated phospholipid phosphatase
LPPVTVAAAAPARRRLFDTRRGLLLLLAGVFMVNLVETTVETWLAPRLPIVAEFRLQTARAAHWFEGYVTFENHELTNRFAVIGYSISYFLFFPLLLLGVGVGLMRRAEIRPFRVFSLGVAVNYLISLPFFLFLPVVERWAYPDTGAMVLSDLWALHLIDIIRPISGIDNSFPSFHTSLTVLAISTAFLFRLPYRWTAAFVGSTVILATLVLGIHWVMDVVAGLATGVLATALAFSVDRRLTHSKSALSERPAAIGNYVAEPQLEPR